MKILEYGNDNNPKIVLIHGFESPYETLNEYIEYFKKKYYVIVPILPGHNPNIREDFISFQKPVEELETYYINKFGNEVYAVYAMSMGGVFAGHIWMNKNIVIKKLILESSPLIAYNNIMIKILTRQYLMATHKLQMRDKKILEQAEKSMLTEENKEAFLKVIDNISDETVVNYVKEIGKFKLPKSIESEETQIYYLYGTNMDEIFSRSTAKYLSKNYKGTNIIKFNGKGHCEDAILKPRKHIEVINNILKNKDD